MNYKLEGKGIFVFSDPAGANCALTLVDNQIKKRFVESKDLLVFSDKFGVFPEEYDTLVARFDFTEELAEQIIKEHQPAFLFAATSCKSDFEHKWRKLAFRLQLKTISFIDYWLHYAERFMFNGETFWGDEIWVINETAKLGAIGAGVPSEIIKVVGNPYYLKVKNHIPKEPKIDFYNKLGIEPSKKTILFISDPIRDSVSSDKNGDSYLGFNEYTVLNDIFHAFGQLKSEIDLSRFQFIIKLHPREEIQKFKNIIAESAPSGLDIISIQKCDPLTINYYSDYVLGMFSNMIIESVLLNKKVLRIQIGEKHDLLSSVEELINLPKKITQKELLPNALIYFLST